MSFLESLFGTNMKDKPRIFISFAMKDIEYRKHLVSQAKEKKTPFYFIDMSVKKRWAENEWKKKCKSKIKGCDGVIVLLSKNTYHAGGARWEMKCARQLNIPMIGMHIMKKNRGSIPPELKDVEIINWSWKNLDNFVNNL